MNIHDYMRQDLIRLDFPAHDKVDLLKNLVQFLVDQKIIADGDEVLESLLEREKLMSTGIKRGFAIPHAFTSHLQESIICFARLHTPIDYQSLDEEPVRFVFLLLGPRDAQGIHLKILARLARLLSLGRLHSRLMDAQSNEEALDIIRKEEEQFQLTTRQS